MPLKKGCTRKTIDTNTKLMLHEGRPAAQAHAIALDTARRACGLFLFCYGSNNTRQLAERLGHVVCARPAMLVNRQRVFRGKSRRWGGGVATLVPGKGMQVLGTLVEVDKNDLKMLDQVEGVAQGAYVRRNVQAIVVEEAVRGRKAKTREVTAYVYLATSKEFHAPSREYLEACAKTVGEFWKDDGKKVTWKSFPVLLRSRAWQEQRDTARTGRAR
jgi:gamma-glutamylcyclotransferase (GGCT)/AIG2-like uncharacterized protein YtfP